MKKNFTILLTMLALTATTLVGQASNKSKWLDRESTSGHSAVSSPFGYFLFGGEKIDGSLSNELWLCQLDGVDFQVVASGGPSARKNHASYRVNGLLFIAGGVDANGNCLNDLWYFDINALTWHCVNNGFPCVSKTTATIIPTKGVYIAGGRNSTGNSLDYVYLLQETDPYYLPVPQPPLPEPLQGSGNFVFDGYVNVFGGLWDDWDPITPDPQPSYSQNTWRYNPNKKTTQGTWSLLPTTGDIKELTDMAYTQDTLENFFYVFGGISYDYVSNSEIYSNEIFKLDLHTNIWTKLSATLPIALAEFTASYHHGAAGNDTIYLIGGKTSAGAVSGAIYAFMVATNSFITITTSLDDISSSNEKLALFPNPVSDILTINISGKGQIAKIEIMNSLGKSIQSIDNPVTGEINLSQQNPGLYFIRIKTKTNSYFRKLVKQ